MSADHLDPEELERIVDGWIRHALLRDPADFWAWDRATEIVHADAEEGWTLVKAMVEAAPDQLLGGIAAGPLEDLVRTHGPAVIDRVETRARRDGRFRECLTQIWLGSDTPEDVVRRLQQATGNQILVLGAQGEGDDDL